MCKSEARSGFNYTTRADGQASMLESTAGRVPSVAPAIHNYSETIYP